MSFYVSLSTSCDLISLPEGLRCINTYCSFITWPICTNNSDSSSFRLDHFDGLIPFDFKTEPTESNSKYLGERSYCRRHNEPRVWTLNRWCILSLRCSPSVNLLSLELTYFCSGLLFAAVVRRRVWDYALTVTLLHVAITSLGEAKHNDPARLLTQVTKRVVKLNVLFPCCSDVGVPHGVAVVAGFR